MKKSFSPSPGPGLLTAQAKSTTPGQPDKSAIHFTYKQMGVAVDGQFRKFASQIISTRQTDRCQATFEVELASVDRRPRRPGRSPASRGSTPGPS